MIVAGLRDEICVEVFAALPTAVRVCFIVNENHVPGFPP